MEYGDEDELLRILHDEYFQECRSLHIGEGSNLLFVNDFEGIVLHSAIKGMTVVDDTPESVLLRVGAGEHWDDVVAFAVANGWGGIENLSHIPGEAGAAAVQNIGAYGVELKDVVETVEAYHQLTFEKRLFTNEMCRYAYRHSCFKEPDHDPYIITSIHLRLAKKPVFRLDYGNLTEVLKGHVVTLQTIREAVIEVRRNKLPEPEALGNAGSFFMNPVIPRIQFDLLKSAWPHIPSYPAGDDRVKIPAGWLIEQCGWKGKRAGHVGVYEKQALILVNHGGATGPEIADFAETICQSVHEKFNITLRPEVRFVQ